MSTQIDAAKNNRPTPMMEQCAKDEGVSIQEIQRSLVEGTAVLPANRNHTTLQKPIMIGKPYRVKINANIGTSQGFSSKEEELAKLKICLDCGANAVMDLSTSGDTDSIRQEILQQSTIPVGSVPIYSTAIKAFSEGKKVIDFVVSDFLDMIKIHAKNGVDFMTLHAGISREVVQKCKESNRMLKMVSRGGSILAGWMLANNEDNPLYTHFDEILSIAHEYDVTLSLGDGLRPGSTMDSTDSSQIMELLVLGELVERAKKAHVQVMVEGPGHIPIHQIQANVQLEHSICNKAPFFVLGPIVSDIAPGYDHIVSAIGGALAACHGADFLCYVTPAEHLCLPDFKDVKEGIMASRIAAHAADLYRGNLKAWELERKMGIARGNLDWEGQFQVSIDPDLARKRYNDRKLEKSEGCSMCGPFCALKIVRDYMIPD